MPFVDASGNPVTLSPAEQQEYFQKNIPSGNFVDAQGKPVALTPEEQQEYFQKTQAKPQPGQLVDSDGKPVDPFKDLSADDLVSLANKNPEQFDLLSQFQARSDLQKDPAMVQKAADAFHELRKPLFGGVTLSGAAKNVAGVLGGLPRNAANLTGGLGLLLNSVGKSVRADLSGDPALQQEAEDDNSAGRQALARSWASTQGAFFGIEKQIKTLAEKAGRASGLSKSLDDYDPSDKVNAFYDALALHNTAGQIAAGGGQIAQAITGGVSEQQPQPEEVSKLTDPFSWWAMGGASKLAGAAAPYAKALLPETGLPSAAELAPKIAGGAVSGVAGAAAKALQVGAKIAPTAAKVGGLVQAAVTHDVGAAFEGMYGAKLAGEAFAKGATGMQSVAQLARQVSGAAPMTSAYAQLIRDSLEAAPGAAAELGKGVAFDVGQLAAAETPQERESAIGLGTAFGLAGAARGLGLHTLSGQIIAPRFYDVQNPVGPIGNYPELTAIHNEQFGQLTPQERAWTNGIRTLLSRANVNEDVFVTGKAPTDQISAALQKAGVSPELADTTAQQGGGRIKLPNGRGLIILQEPESAPHEAMHAIDDLLGEETNRNLDDYTKAVYADQWENFGQKYASDLTGGNAGDNWRETILDKSGWGRTEAINKLLGTVWQQYAQEARANGQPTPSMEDIKPFVQQHFQNLDENWRNVLSPQEVSDIADRYVAREYRAENFDAWMKHAGPTLEAGRQLPEKVANAIGGLMTNLGMNPLADRRTGLGVTPDIGLINQIRGAVGEAAPNIAPAEPKSGTTARPLPVPPAGRLPVGAPQAPADTQAIASSTPDVRSEGALDTQKNISKRLAALQSAQQGARLTYRSAPGEPAGAPAQSRAVRRNVIEYSRSMPADTKQLFPKMFFPARAFRLKNGDTMWGGWVPEIFAANANRVAQWAAETGNEALVPYPIDTAAKTFTKAGWQQLLAHTQGAVQNYGAGRGAAGQPLIVPEGVQQAGGYQPPLGEASKFGPESQRQADFISMLFGTGQLPKTSRFSPGETQIPLSIAGEEVSKATQPGRVQPPVVPRGKFEGPKAEAAGVAGRDVVEVNPTRAELERAGQSAGNELPKMLEAYQKLNLRDILHAEPAPEQPKFGANVLALTAGFKPKAGEAGEEPERIRAAAIRTRDGQIFKGPSHRKAADAAADAGVSDLDVDHADTGFITSKGRFVNRIAASTVATESGQLPKAYKGFELDASALKHMPGTEQSVQFTPSKDPRAVKSPAIRDEDTGKVYEGVMHAAALMDYLAEKHPDQMDNALDALFNQPKNITDGFTTNTPGEFLNRAEALQRATELKQYTATPSERGLESMRLAAGSAAEEQRLARSGEEAQFAAKQKEQLEDEGYVFKLVKNNDGNLIKAKASLKGKEIASVNISSDKKTGAANVNMAFTEPEHRRQGISSALYAMAADELKKQGFHTLYGDAGAPAFNLRKEIFPNTYLNDRGETVSQLRPKTYIVRHGATEMNNADPDKDLIRGHIDVPLNAQGRQDADKVARDIADSGGVDHIISSDLQRTMSTAKAISEKTGATIEADPRLRPWAFGPTIEGQPTSKMLPKIKRLTENPDERPPGGETFNEFKDRFLSGFHDAQDNYPDINTAIVTHYRGTKLLEAWRKTGVDNDTIDKAVFEKYDKNAKPGFHDVVDKTGAKIDSATIRQESAKEETPDTAQFATPGRRRKEDYVLKEGPGSFSKAWILPDGKPVQLGGQWHHEWINQNPDVTKKYGLKTTDSSEENRVDALKKGFARINYAKNTGTLTVEARQKDWPNVRESVRRMVEANLPKIDNMDVHLLDAKAQKAVDSDGVALHTYNMDERMQNLPYISTPGETTTMSPQASSEGAQFATSKEIEKALGDIGELPGYAHRRLMERARDAGRMYTGIGANPEDLNRAIAEQYLAEKKANENAQFAIKRSKPEPEEFQKPGSLKEALAKPNWAILTASQEARGKGTDEVNQIANENLEKALIADGYNPLRVKGSYKGEDQGLNFLVTGISPEEALELGKKYGQESVLTPHGLLYQDGTVNPVNPAKHLFGDEAKQQDFYSQAEPKLVRGKPVESPAFSLGIDFDKRIPLEEAQQANPIRGPITAAKPAPDVVKGRQRTPEEGEKLSLQHVIDSPDMQDFAKEVVSRIVKLPGFKNIKTGDTTKAMQEISKRFQQNLRFLYDRATPENRQLWRQWYDLANKMTKEWGAEFGMHPDVVAAVNAKLSPQMDWYNNVTLTRKVLETFKQNPTFTPADRDVIRSHINMKDENERNDWLNELAGIKDGQKMSDMTDAQAGMFVRSHNELQGELATHDHELEPVGGETGWSKSFDELRSVMSILRNPSRENVNRELGSNHKVRSFYNNHVAPESPNWTTIDTHAGAAATLLPHGAGDQATKEIFGATKHKASGYNGAFFLYQHAYETLAKELGLLPRELQSIVWEQIRQEQTPEGKRAMNREKNPEAWKAIEKVHRAIDDGKMTPAEGREAVLKIYQENEPSKAKEPVDLDIEPF